MPLVEPAIASLIGAPDEALRPSARCPCPQCVALRTICCAEFMILVPDWDGLAIFYPNFCWVCQPHLRVLRLADPVQGLMDVSLHAFDLMSREIGYVLSTQVSLAQSPLTETCRRTLIGLPCFRRRCLVPLR
ncbi:hypothetical protein ATANTOWER_011035 [Ataeniobius toweri]|uniref:Transposase n=1 Tax=Ataeniobius toweri TaxID=208326 RepID=A0ABU7CHZ0_9TELE|nr:hypothetical protein [Ataeniobius toweri]